jgi:hypothetical protein
MSAIISQIEGAGFNVKLDGDDLVINPSNLSPQQLAYVRRHKPEIVDAIRLHELEASPSGADMIPANDEVARLFALPSDLVQLTIRYCVEFYADTPDQVRTMLDDLEVVPDDWHWWRQYLMKKLEIPPEVQCCNCQHCEATSGNLGRCLRGLRGPGASSLWWMTDTHLCIQFSAVQEAA